MFKVILKHFGDWKLLASWPLYGQSQDKISAYNFFLRMPVSFTCSFTKWLQLKFLVNDILIDKLCYIIPCIPQWVVMQGGRWGGLIWSKWWNVLLYKVKKINKVDVFWLKYVFMLNLELISIILSYYFCTAETSQIIAARHCCDLSVDWFYVIWGYTDCDF